MITIFITEKPSVAQEYKKVLGVQQDKKTDGYIEGYSNELGKDVVITWAVGHLISLACVEEQMEGRIMKAKELKENKKRWSKSNLPILPSNWLYKINSATYDQFQVVKKIYTRKDIEAIYYAGDSGREGIYIQALIRNQIFSKKPNFDEKVVWIDSFTKEAILKGIKEAKDYSYYQPMIDSGYERAISDWLIGMNLTQAFTLTSGSLVKVGRVMTPTLALIVKRQKEIDDFTPTNYYGINAPINTDLLPKWKNKDASREDKLYNENGFLYEEDAKNLISSLSGTLEVTDVSVQKKKELAPLLFNLADLQATCSKMFHISPAKTLEIAQSLYEEKRITYPRTDSRYLTTAVANDIKRCGKNVGKKYVDDSKVTDHYALIPTNYSPTLTNGDSIKEKVYDVIVKRFLSIFYPAYEYEAINVEYKDGNEYFYANTKKVLEKGWRALYGENAPDVAIPIKGAVFHPNYEVNPMQTSAPSSYTTGSLILAMEKAGKLIEDEELREQIKTCGIGTSATRSNIIEKLSDTGYITIDKKQKIAPTDLGKSIIPIIEKYDSQLVSPEKTADMEQKLQDIVDKKTTREEYNASMVSYITSSVSNVLQNNNEKLESSSNKTTNNGSLGTCPHCGGEVKVGKFGVYCTNKCGMGFKIYGKDLTEKQVMALLSGKGIKTKNGKYTNTILPEVVENEWNGKTYFNFKIGN